MIFGMLSFKKNNETCVRLSTFDRFILVKFNINVDKFGNHSKLFSLRK